MFRTIVAVGLALCVQGTALSAPKLTEVRRAIRARDYAGADLMLKRLRKSGSTDPSTLGLSGEVCLALNRLKKGTEFLKQAGSLDSKWKARGAQALALADFARGLQPGAPPRSLKKRLEYLDAPTGLAVSRGKSAIVYGTPALKQAKGLSFGRKALQAALKSYARLLKWGASEVVPRLYLFDDEHSYRAFLKEAGHTQLANAGGFYVPETRILVVRTRRPGSPLIRPGWSEEGLHAIAHEAFHLALASRAPHENAPEWFNEGMAELFALRRKPATMTFNRTAATPAQTAPGRLLAAYRGRIPVSLSEIVALRHEHFHHPSRQQMHYAVAWSFVRYLGNSVPGGTKLLRKIIRLLREGRPRAAVERETIGRLDLGRLDGSWRVQAP